MFGIFLFQNQPALEKDQYKIRDAFVAEEGNTFIVADYGQLELRILAHITKCEVIFMKSTTSFIIDNMRIIFTFVYSLILLI